MDDKRIFLAVPYEEREAARAIGARWDATLKVWYVGEGADQRKVARWLPGTGEPPLSPRDEFIATMTAHGLLAIERHPIADGRNHRIPVEGDKVTSQGRYTRPSGRYALHLDGHPAGYVRNFRTGIYASWKSTGFRLPPHEMAALRADIAEREKAHVAEQAQAIEAAAKRARQRTARLVPVAEPTGYMVSKSIRPTIGALTDAAGITTYLPAIDIDGKQWTLQTIKGDGQKLFVKGSRKEGTFHIVDGDLDALQRAATLVIAEGYATAVVITDAIGQPAIAAFDAGNLLPVAVALRDRFPDRPILIAGDDDYGVALTEGHNPGRDKASAAAAAVDGITVFPVFADGEREVDPRGFTDFHDLASRSRIGRDGAHMQIKAALSELLGRPGGTAREGLMAEEQPEPRDQDRRREPPVEPPSPPTKRPLEAPRSGFGRANSIRAGERDQDETDRRSGGVDGPSERSDPSLKRGDVPDDVASRYRVETGSRRYHEYYESHSAGRPAFRDRGDRLTSNLDSAAVIADLVAIAEHRSWQPIKVEGTKEFRREVWLRAERSGLEVTGYRPTERDILEAAARTKAVPPTKRTPGQPAFAKTNVGNPTARVLLSVPFAEKDDAKAAGAKWDHHVRSWYIEEAHRDGVARWMPDTERLRVETVIGRDRAAVEQMRTIEAVVGSTLADNPVAASRVIDAGRAALASKVEQGETIRAPLVRTQAKKLSDALIPTVSRKPRDRAR